MGQVSNLPAPVSGPVALCHPAIFWLHVRIPDASTSGGDCGIVWGCYPRIHSTHQLLTWDCHRAGGPPPMTPHGLGGHSTVLQGDVAPMWRATVLLGTKIFPVRENLATPEMVPMGTATLNTATVADVRVPPEMLHPDHFPTEAGPPPDPLPGLPSFDVLSCADQHPVEGRAYHCIKRRGRR